jgi:hypothetical protein
MSYNIANNTTPRYLCDVIPPTIQSATVYPLHNESDIIIPICRLSIQGRIQRLCSVMEQYFQ